MRIAIATHGIFPYDLGGMERHTTFLANHLVDCGARVDVFAPTIGARRPISQHVQLKFNLVELDWPLCRPWLRANYVFSARIAAKLKSGYDAVYCQGFNAWAYLEQADRWREAVTLFNPHGLEMFKTHSLGQTLKHLPMRFAAKRQAKLADVTISLGGRLTEQVLRYLPVQKDRVVELPNATDIKYIDGLRPRSAEKVENQFVFVGRLAKNKGVDLLCRAFQQTQNASLVIVGGGPLETELKSLYGHCSNITFAGRVDDPQMFELYANSECFIFSSLYEGMPTVILEAMSCELPVIATDIGAVKTMVHADTGFIVKPGSISELQGGIEKFILLEAAQKKRMGQCARQRVSDHFTWKIVAQQTLEVIESRLRAAKTTRTLAHG